MSKKASKARQPAAGYIRTSGRQQDQSAAAQRTEITQLAAREGYRVVHWFTDQGPGDGAADNRPGLASLLAGAKAGKFSIVLAWDRSRFSRQGPWEAVQFLDCLRRARVKRIHTCHEGAIDTDSFVGTLTFVAGLDSQRAELVSAIRRMSAPELIEELASLLAEGASVESEPERTEKPGARKAPAAGPDRVSTTQPRGPRPRARSSTRTR
jgi:DNA invertase Pin-like site-specific DNA recombinase